MERITQLIVSISIGTKEIEVGELVLDRRKIFFKYYPSFLETGLEISPFKLSLSNQILQAETEVFDGLFGVFDDSLPDGWGRLLLDRTLTSRGISLSEISPLDRLSFVGRTGPGALIYQPSKDSIIDHHKQLELDEIARESLSILQGTSSDVIEELFQLGGSSGGARPKILIGWHPQRERIIFGIDNLPEGYEHWIIKFPTSGDMRDIANVEYAYHKMALDAGLEMSKCRLFKGASGMQYFGTQRFDRIENQRIHLHSAAGLMHDNFRLSSLDYGHVMDAAFRLENHIGAYEKVLELAAFNIFAHNRDDHSKNISFLMNQTGSWQLAPAYDLTFSNSSHGFHSTTVAGEGKSPGSKHLLELANIFGVKNANEIIDKIKGVTNNWKNYAKECGVSKDSIQIIENVLQKKRD